MMRDGTLISNSNLDFGTVDNLLSLTVDGENARPVNSTVEVEVTFELFLKILQMRHTVVSLH